MQHRNHHIQRMSRADLGLALQWADQEGWNPGRQDTDIFHPIDVRGHFMARVDDEPVASVSGLRYSVSYGFLGLYIVRELVEANGGTIRYEPNRPTGSRFVVELPADPARVRELTTR